MEVVVSDENDAPEQTVPAGESSSGQVRAPKGQRFQFSTPATATKEPPARGSNSQQEIQVAHKKFFNRESLRKSCNKNVQYRFV